jgi:threonine dehydrogenase-like Zn-dependent dehydrogenase
MESTFELTDHGGRIVLVGLVKGQLRLDDPNFHRRELSLLATRNSTPETFRRLIGRMESGQVDTSMWITHRLGLAEVVDRFATLSEQPDLVKAMVEV